MSRTRCAIGIVVTGVVTLLVPAHASAAVDVSASTDGSIRVDGSDAADVVTIARATDGTLHVADPAGATSSDGSCTIVLDTAAIACTAASGAAVDVRLGSADDTLDALGATGIALAVDGGVGSDTYRLGAGGTSRIVDVGSSDTIDLSHANDVVTVRWSRSRARVVASCGGCDTSWSVVMPGRPGTVRLGPDRDDIDLRSWRARGTTRWQLGADDDRFLGSPVRRSIVLAGAGVDSLVSYAASDVLRGEAGDDKLADFGGRGDVLQGGSGIDALSSMDARRDTLDGQVGRDFCLSPRGHDPRFCDTGPVRGMEDSRYLPLTTRSWVLMMLGIR